ncbi:MAG: ribbon-helix-helix protein, CopG family [Pseudonocardiaceae bacterium]
MSMLTRRLQILLDEDRYARLERLARRRGASVATIVREAIDAAFPADGPDRAEAARRVLDADPIPVSDWPLIKDEIDRMYEPAVE